MEEFYGAVERMLPPRRQRRHSDLRARARAGGAVLSARGRRAEPARRNDPGVPRFADGDLGDRGRSNAIRRPARRRWRTPFARRRSLAAAGTAPSAARRADSIAINRVTGGAVILAGSGMCTGGRVLHHLRHNLGRPASAIVFVGYAAEGTLARKIIDGASEVTIGDDRIRVRARIHTDQRFLGPRRSGGPHRMAREDERQTHIPDPWRRAGHARLRRQAWERLGRNADAGTELRDLIQAEARGDGSSGRRRQDRALRPASRTSAACRRCRPAAPRRRARPVPPLRQRLVDLLSDQHRLGLRARAGYRRGGAQHDRGALGSARPAQIQHHGDIGDRPVERIFSPASGASCACSASGGSSTAVSIFAG